MINSLRCKYFLLKGGFLKLNIMNSIKSSAFPLN